MQQIYGVHIVPSIEEEASGPSYSVVELCKHLHNKGENIYLFTIGNKSKYKFHYAFERFKFIPRIGFSNLMYKEIVRLARLGKIHYIHSHGLWMMPNIYAYIVAKKYKIPLITSPRGALSKKALGTGNFFVKFFFWTLLQKKALSYSSAFHATSYQEYIDIRRMGYKQPVAIVPNGIDLRINIDSESLSSKNILLFLGRLHRIKGLENLLRAWKNVYKEFPDWMLLIAGPGEEKYVKDLLKLSNKIKLKNYEFCGPLYGEEKWNAYNAAKLYILPSYSENFGMTIAESLSVGTPVIASTNTPWKDVEIYNSGFWTDNDVKSLSLCLNDALSDIKRLESMGQNGRKWMEDEFSWSKVATKMNELYKFVVNNTIPDKFIKLYDFK